MLKQSRYFLKIIGICSLIILVSCRSTYVTESFKDSETPLTPNYQNEDSWVVLPSKYTEELTKLTSVWSTKVTGLLKLTV